MPMEDNAQTADIPFAGERDIPLTVVAWGDSIGNFVGINLKRIFSEVVNLGRNGAGLKNAFPPAPLDSIPQGAAVIMSIGTNDVVPLMQQPDNAVNAYADEVIGIARQIRDKGATPVLLGLQAPAGPFTLGPSYWRDSGFVEKWSAEMDRVNEALKRAAGKAGIAFSPVAGRVKEHTKDNLHYTALGSRRIARNALKDAGLK